MSEEKIFKNVHFIRHGQSEGNVLRVFQAEDDPLTELGIQQAHQVAESVTSLNGEKILSSPLKRALDTANIIKEKTGIPLEVHDDLKEATAPKSLIGHGTTSEESSEYYSELFEHVNDPDWRYDSEENYHDLYTRTARVLDYIVSIDENNIIVVTHGAFLSMLISTMALEGIPDGVFATKLFRFLRQSNTGITTCVYRDDEATANNWGLFAWNSNMHLKT